MTSGIGHLPRPQAPNFPPPPLFWRRLVLAIRSCIPATRRTTNNHRVSIVDRRGAQEAELVEPRGPHVVGCAEEDGREPQDRVQEAVAREQRAGKGKVGGTEVDAEDDADAPDNQRCDADQVDKRVHEERWVVARGLGEALRLEARGVRIVVLLDGEVTAAALLLPKDVEDDAVYNKRQNLGVVQGISVCLLATATKPRMPYHRNNDPEVMAP